jgi:hypothetical protein
VKSLLIGGARPLRFANPNDAPSRSLVGEARGPNSHPAGEGRPWTRSDDQRSISLGHETIGTSAARRRLMNEQSCLTSSCDEMV